MNSDEKYCCRETRSTKGVAGLESWGPEWAVSLVRTDSCPPYQGRVSTLIPLLHVVLYWSLRAGHCCWKFISWGIRQSALVRSPCWASTSSLCLKPRPLCPWGCWVKNGEGTGQAICCSHTWVSCVVGVLDHSSDWDPVILPYGGPSWDVHPHSSSHTSCCSPSFQTGSHCPWHGGHPPPRPSLLLGKVDIADHFKWYSLGMFPFPIIPWPQVGLKCSGS